MSIQHVCPNQHTPASALVANVPGPFLNACSLMTNFSLCYDVARLPQSSNARKPATSLTSKGMSAQNSKGQQSSLSLTLGKH
eukprot:scaffold95618_cov14-Tisochrysis_lutea.AAC.2